MAAVVCVGVLLAFEGVIHAAPQHGLDLPFARFHVVASCVVITVAAVEVTVPRRRWRLCLAGLLMTAAVVDAAATQRLAAIMVSTTDPTSIEAWKRVTSEKKQSLVVSRRRSDRSAWDAVRGNKNLLPKRPVLASYAPLRNGIHAEWIKDPLLVQVATGRDRFFFASAVVETPPSSDAFSAFRDRAHILGSPPLVVQRPRAMLTPAQEQALDERTARQLGSLESARRVPVRISRYLPNELVLTAECPENGWLLVTDRWAPSWRATVNGVDTPIWGGDFIFRAVPVRAGRNEVSFFYRPFGFPYLWGLACCRRCEASLPSIPFAIWNQCVSPESDRSRITSWVSIGRPRAASEHPIRSSKELYPGASPKPRKGGRITCSQKRPDHAPHTLRCAGLTPLRVRRTLPSSQASPPRPIWPVASLVLETSGTESLEPQLPSRSRKGRDPR